MHWHWLGIADLGPELIGCILDGWVFVWVDMAGGGKWLYWLYFGCGEIFGLRVEGWVWEDGNFRGLGALLHKDKIRELIGFR